MAAHVESINLTFTTNTCSGTFATTVNIGNVIAVAAGGLDVPSTPTDNLGHTYTVVETPTAQDGVTVKTWYTVVTIGGSCTVSVFFGTGGGSEAQAMLMNGMFLGTPLDQHRSQNQTAVATTNNALNSLSRPTGLNGELIFGYTYNTDRVGLTISPGTTETFATGASATNSKTEYAIKAAAGTTAARFTTGTAGHNFITVLMTFKPTQPVLVAVSGVYVVSGVATVLRPGSTVYLRYGK